MLYFKLFAKNDKIASTPLTPYYFFAQNFILLAYNYKLEERDKLYQNMTKILVNDDLTNM